MRQDGAGTSPEFIRIQPRIATECTWEGFLLSYKKLIDAIEAIDAALDRC